MFGGQLFLVGVRALCVCGTQFPPGPEIWTPPDSLFSRPDPTRLGHFRQTRSLPNPYLIQNSIDAYTMYLYLSLINLMLELVSRKRVAL